jgi:hypothetical protein
MQVDAGVFQSGMSQQTLNGTEIGTGFQQVSCATVSQGMRRKMFGEAGGSGSMLTRQPHHIGGDGHVGPPTIYRTGEQKGLRLHPAPVDAQRLQQLGAQRNIPVAATLALVNTNHHGLAVDIGPLNDTVPNAAWPWSTGS